MTLRNRSLVRKPVGMLRAHSTEQDHLDYLVEYYGGEASAVWREVLIEKAKELRHASNPLAANRLDKSSFGSFHAA